LQQLEELSKDMWGDLDISDGEINNNPDFEMLGL
jgi:hypothetical protein